MYQNENEELGKPSDKIWWGEFKYDISSPQWSIFFGGLLLAEIWAYAKMLFDPTKCENLASWTNFVLMPNSIFFYFIFIFGNESRWNYPFFASNTLNGINIIKIKIGLKI